MKAGDLKVGDTFRWRGERYIVLGERLDVQHLETGVFDTLLAETEVTRDEG